MYRTVLLLALAALLLSACVTRPTPAAEPTSLPASVASTTTPVPTPTLGEVKASATPTLATRPSLVPTTVPTASAVSLPGGVSLPVFDVEDCMAGCHPPDPNDFFDAGAVVQPADHKGRTTCLNCHAAPDHKPLPETHIGRLDPSCAPCHKPPK